MKKGVIILLSVCSFQLFAQSSKCEKIPLSKWIDASALHDKKIEEKILIFEQYFDDTLTFMSNNKIVAKEYIRTIKSLEVSPKIIKLPFFKNNIYLKVGNNCYKFHLKRKYKYYYFNKYLNNIGIQYSNYQREYY